MSHVGEVTVQETVPEHKRVEDCFLVATVFQNHRVQIKYYHIGKKIILILNKHKLGYDVHHKQATKEISKSTRNLALLYSQADITHYIHILEI